jgi:Tfp pilus assembly protein PilX
MKKLSLLLFAMMFLVQIGFGQEVPKSPKIIDSQPAQMETMDKSIGNVPKCFCCNEKIFQIPKPPITGTDKICKDSKNVFNTIGCEGAIINWSTNPAGINFSGQGTSQIIIDYSSVPSTAFVIVITVEIKCGNKSIKNSMKVSVCKPVEVNITKGEDALIHCLNTQASINYGNYNANMASNWTYDGTPGITSSVLKFDLSSVPTNATIISATLILKEFCNAGSGGTNLYSNSTKPNALTIERVTTAWSEGSVTCDSKLATVSAGSITLPSVQGTWSVGTDNPILNVTAMVQAMLSNNQGFIIRLSDQNAGNYYRARSFGSFNNTNPSLRPVLSIVYQ